MRENYMTLGETARRNRLPARFANEVFIPISKKLQGSAFLLNPSYIVLVTFDNVRG